MHANKWIKTKQGYVPKHIYEALKFNFVFHLKLKPTKNKKEAITPRDSPFNERGLVDFLISFFLVCFGIKWLCPPKIYNGR